MSKNEYNMDLIRVLSDDYYQNRITYSEYKKERTNLLNQIDEEFNGVIIEEEVQQAEKSLMNKALAFLKLDNLKETS